MLSDDLPIYFRKGHQELQGHFAEYDRYDDIGKEVKILDDAIFSLLRLWVMSVLQPLESLVRVLVPLTP